ncbi:response regulator transcription factor [Bifidobacterium sp. MA2]|uniref:Response regulator transcription factor n=1 Tax=Bifidobacterium santillanense TaxID=2809028 RepID=A0ABS5UN03_9BIFI|nr:response regulator transcription factor [Bifidobacterium santillanense]MBT1172180.1 response regulator transcription factor [Bifidobacterium santillanense]
MNGTSGIVDVAVLDNDSMALERLVAVLPKLLPGLHVAWSTSSAPEADRRCLDEEWRPRMLVTDVELDRTTGMDVCRSIRAAGPEPLLLAMTSYNPKTYAARLAESGAQGLMVKGDMTQMTAALRRVASGDTFSPVTGTDFPTADEAHRRLGAGGHAGRAAETPRDAVSTLSALERRILSSVAEGYSNEEIAATLEVSPATVRSHTRHIREKLGARTLSHAVAIWLTRRGS